MIANIGIALRYWVTVPQSSPFDLRVRRHYLPLLHRDAAQGTNRQRPRRRLGKPDKLAPAPHQNHHDFTLEFADADATNFPQPFYRARLVKAVF